ncbi:MAG: NTP transferase domain-containing protein [Lachnospiraceae bacterium]|nr:NTP transferase domain-containing protein [Lachnospiraceae bacterium]
MSAVILAGGEGKRMKSDKPKALSEVLNKPMLRWVIDSVKGAGIDNVCVVTGFKREYIEEYLHTLPFDTETAYQPQRLGTGHAVMMCREFLRKNEGDVVVLNGDAPFMDSETVKEAYRLHKESNSSATVISAKVDDPFGYGRIVRDADGAIKAIVEQKDASKEEQSINEVNSGGYWFNTESLLGVLDEITANNAGGEYYLTDAVSILLNKGKTVCAYTAQSSNTVLGANDPEQLKRLNEIARAKEQ